MCLFSDAELYCVNTNMRITSELMQFDIGTSTRRYFPPSGTAGFERSRVRGNRRLPAPPPRITASRLCLAGIRWRGYKESPQGFKDGVTLRGFWLFLGSDGAVARPSGRAYHPHSHLHDEPT